MTDQTKATKTEQKRKQKDTHEIRNPKIKIRETWNYFIIYFFFSLLLKYI